MKTLAGLTHSERLQLLRFVSSAIWADLEVSPSEKTYLLSLALRLGLSEAEMERAHDWLEKPPPPEEVDPFQVPPQHRRLFLEAMEEAMTADRGIDAPEMESLSLLRQLLE
jgi:hypothetical protein